MVKSSTGDAAAMGEPEGKTPEKRAAATGEAQFFDGTVVKIDTDGNEVMSDHLLPGEKLRRDVSELHFANPAQVRADDAARSAARTAAAEAKKQ